MQIQTTPRLSRYRNELKGIAILWVVFFHMAFQSPGLLYHVQKIGYGGVDIFFFLTGYGLYHSLHKGRELRSYWRRRMSRIMPAYLPFILCWIFMMLPRYGLRTTEYIRSILGNLFMIGYWLGAPSMLNWYVSSLIMFFLLAPFLFACIFHSKKPFRTLVILIGCSLLIGLCCIGEDRYMAISRLPIFILGMAFAMEWKYIWKSVAGRLAMWFSFLIGVSTLFLCFSRYSELLAPYGMYWHPFVLITPPLCLSLCCFFHHMEKAQFLLSPLRVLGKASFEIYLFNVWLEKLCKDNKVDNPWICLLASLGCLLVGVGYHWSIQRVVGWTHTLKKRMFS